MAGIVTRPQTTYTHPRWAKDYLNREHVLPGGAKIDSAQFAADNAVQVTVNQGATASEVQTITLTNTPTGGTFTVGYKGVTTPPQAFNVPTATLQTALRALSTINGANVTVTGTAGSSYVVTFGGTLANQDVDPLVATGTALTGSGAQPQALVAVTTPGNAGEVSVGATTMTVAALGGPIPTGTMLMFGGGQIAYVSANAATGATSITTEPLAFAVPNGAVAYYRGTGWVTIQDGTVVGRTYAERDAGTPFGPAADTDDEIYILAYTVDDARTNNDADLYRWGGLVDETHLPGFSGLSTAIKTSLRSRYQCTVGAE